MHPWARPARPIPLPELWDRSGTILSLRPRRWVGAGDIAALLREPGARFVRADPGMPLDWIAPAETFAFWKAEVRPRVVDPALGEWSIEDYPGAYCFRAQEWRDPRDPGAPPWIVVYYYH